MHKLIYIIMFLFITAGFLEVFPQSPQRKDFGFGIIFGDPTGGTLKFWTNSQNAFVIDVGTSFFGKPRIGVDYLWHFDAFNSDIAYLYAGPGGAIGFGEGDGFWYKGRFHRTGNEIGLGVRGVFGVNVIPRNTPLEVFFEIGALLGLVPDFGSAVDAAIGMRFYP
jgi:hypothetical protein